MKSKNESQSYIDEVGIGHTIRYSIKEKLFSAKSEYQTVEVVDTDFFGKMLFNDGLVMVSERDEHAYHEMMAHVPLFTHPNPKKVLIIGGGDGGTAREVLRHKTVEKCDMVEIDAVVVEACRRFIPQTSIGMSDNSRFHLMIADGVKYMEETEEVYDVILIDSTEPIGPSAPLFGSDFYANVKKRLGYNGIVVSQGESPYYNPTMQRKLYQILSENFDKTWFLNFSNLTYPGGLWSFSVATNGLDPVKDFKVERVKESGFEFQYYNAGLHQSCFQLPEFQRRNLGTI